MKAWGSEMKQWQQSEQMQQWQRKMEDWQKQMQEWAQSLVHDHADAQGAAPDTRPAPMPPMPEMPRVDIPRIEVPVVVPPIPPVPPIPSEIPENAENQGEIVSQSSFGSIPGDRILEVENHVGSITVRSADQSGYEVHAITRVKADTKERIREIDEQLSITDTGPLANGVERIIVSKPKDLKDRENVTVAIEVIAPRKARLKLRQEVGDIRLAGLRGELDASNRVGAIRAADISGQVALNVEVGGIDFVVPQDLSAKVQAKAELGGVQSDLPLEFVKSDGLAMGHSASGTIGGGEGTISLKTKMGSIHIRSKAAGSAQGERSRREPRPEPKPQPRPAPQAEEVF